jgi:hypothetical protein
MAKKKSGKKERIDFGGVTGEPGERSRHIPEGEYLAKIISHKKRWKDDDRTNDPFFSWKLQINEGKYKGTTLYENTSLKAEALFNLRNLIFAALGKNVAGKTVDFDPASLYGKVVAVTVEDEEYKKKMRSHIVDIRPKEELEDEEDEDEDEEGEEDEEDEEEEEDEGDEDEEEDEDLEDVDIEEL